MTEPSNLRDAADVAAEIYAAAYKHGLIPDITSPIALIRADRAAVEAAVEAATIAKVVSWLDAQASGRLQSPVYLARCIEAGEWKQ